MLKSENKVIGCFSYNKSKTGVLCDGDACIISGTKGSMHKYIKKLDKNNKEKYIIKKTTFGEVMKGLGHGAAYAFDEDSYKEFLSLAEKNGIEGLPTVKEFFSIPSPTELHFMRLQIV